MYHRFVVPIQNLILELVASSSLFESMTMFMMFTSLVRGLGPIPSIYWGLKNILMWEELSRVVDRGNGKQ